MIEFVPFPALTDANEDGLLAMGGDLKVNTLVSAYSQGIFPWYNEGQPILWWSPDPRLVIFPSKMHVSRSLKKLVRQEKFELRCNSDFEGVLNGCALRGQNQPGSPTADTWISPEMHDAYLHLNQAGYAHSIEAWHNQKLVGGLYGVVLGSVFFGESMFSAVNNASKVALYGLCQWLMKKKFSVIDCQIANDHLLSLGAEEIPRNDFCQYLREIDINHAPANFGTGFAKFASQQFPAITKE